MSTPASMRAPRFIGDGHIEWIEKAVPQPEPGQLLIAVGANALCGSERGQFYGGSSVTPGHEAAGTVVAAGAQTSTAIGTPGAIFLMDFCGACRSCQLGFTNQCSAKRADMGFTHDGGYGPFELIHQSIFFPTGSDIGAGEATLLLDIMGTGGHALSRAQLVRPDIESLLVCGAGPIGLGVLAMAKVLWGHSFPVAITDVSSQRLRLAAQMGAQVFELSHQSLTGRFDIAVDTTGKTIARRTALDALDARGVLVCVGHGEGLELQVSTDLIAPERAVLGSEYFRFDELPANLERLRAHRDYLGQIITQRYPLVDIQRAFEKFFGGAAGKIIIEQ